MKKIEHVNSDIEAKLDEVHKVYKKEILRISDSFLKEISELKQDKRNALESVAKIERDLVAK